MTEKITFKCEGCDQVIEIDPTDNKIPECCGKPMKKGLPVCITTETAEHARSDDAGEPCDDGRSG